MSIRKNHALHNREVAHHLKATTEYFDWVVTTSFYAALNIVKHKLFPLDIGEDQYRTFESYYNNHLTDYNISKHKAIRVLISKEPSVKIISSDFNALFDLCDTSRYRDYKTSEPIAEKALTLMEAIFKHCDVDKKVKRKRVGEAAKLKTPPKS